MEGNNQSNSVSLALQTLHRTIEKTHFDPKDAILDLKALVKVVKINNHEKAREYECVLNEVMILSRVKSLRKPTSYRSKCSLIRGPPHLRAGSVLMLISLVIQATLVVVGVSRFPDVVHLILMPVFVLLCVIFVAPVSIFREVVLLSRMQNLLLCRISVPYSVVKPYLFGPY